MSNLEDRRDSPRRPILPKGDWIMTIGFIVGLVVAALVMGAILPKNGGAP